MHKPVQKNKIDIIKCVMMVGSIENLECAYY